MIGEKKIEISNLLDIFPPSEGMITQIYGPIGSGKSYATVRMIFDRLRRGKVVYVNFPIGFEGYDERKSKFRIFVSLLFPWIKRFYYFKAENLKFFEISDSWAMKQGYPNFTAWVHSRTDCDIFADEGHVWVDSYMATRMPIELRNISLHTRHYNRNIFIISQRPTAIHVTMRANVNVFYKCEKIFQMGRVVRFKVSEYQDLKNETVDEDEEKRVSKRYYWGRKRFFQAYDTRYLRKGMGISQYPAFEAYRLNFLGKMAYFMGFKSKKSTPKLSTHKEPVKVAVLSQSVERVVELGHGKVTSINIVGKNDREESVKKSPPTPGVAGEFWAKLKRPVLVIQKPEQQIKNNHVNKTSKSDDVPPGKQRVVSAIRKQTHRTTPKSSVPSDESDSKRKVQRKKRKVRAVKK